MHRKLTKHISYAAKMNGVPVWDVRIAYESRTKTEAIAAIRNRAKCTFRQAGERFAAAQEVVLAVRAQRSKGYCRRKNAEIAPSQSVYERKTNAIRRIIGGALPGEHYSGETVWKISAVPRTEVSAKTTTSSGEQYSRRVTWHKRDAVHWLNICFGDLVAARRTPVPASIDQELVIRAQQVRPDIYELTTIGTKGKAVDLRHRYAANQGGGQWHLAKTERGAVIALNRSIRQAETERLGKINATTCQNWGWCAVGIKQWCVRHGIRRNLASRLRKGAKSTAIARLIAKHGGPRDAYERRLLMAAGIEIEA
jgi:hypothetical protein